MATLTVIIAIYPLVITLAEESIGGRNFLRFHTLVLHLISRESSSSEYRVRGSTRTAAGDEKSWKKQNGLSYQLRM